MRVLDRVAAACWLFVAALDAGLLLYLASGFGWLDVAPPAIYSPAALIAYAIFYAVFAARTLLAAACVLAIGFGILRQFRPRVTYPLWVAVLAAAPLVIALAVIVFEWLRILLPIARAIGSAVIDRLGLFERLAIYDGATIRIYINGVLDTAEPAVPPGDIQPNHLTDLGIGNQAELTRPRQFNGIIDEGALYPEALSPERIQAHVDALSPLAGLDHFNCYAVFPREPFRPVNVTLRDQFEKLVVTVLRPILLCNPTDKAHGEEFTAISNPEGHLTCYLTRPVEPPPFRPRSVIVSNQFGDRQPLIAFLRANVLCVPSLKRLVTPGTPGVE